MSEVKYKVIKPFVDETGKLWTINEEPTMHEIKISMQSSLKEFGFIEPYTPEHKHWRAEINGDTFWYISDFGRVTEFHDWHECIYDELYDSGNYYRTEATAELAAKARNLLFEWLHDSTQPSAHFLHVNIEQELLNAMDEARKAVLEDDSNE